jgi:membrane-associated phospholipid phosphatase
MPAWCQATERDEQQPPPKQRSNSGLGNLKSDGIYLLTFPKRTTRRGLVTASAVLGGIAVLIMLDDEIRQEVQQARNDSLDRWESRIEPFGRAEVTSLAAGLIYATGALSQNERVEETGKALLETLLYTELFKSAGKGLTGRLPPGPDSRAADFFDGGSIFPSGHTARAFAFATVLAERHGKKAAWFAYPVATLVGLFRIENDTHWASDVLAGAALGWAVGKAVTRRREERRLKRITVSPGFSPDGRAPGLYLRISF